MERRRVVALLRSSMSSGWRSCLAMTRKVKIGDGGQPWLMPSSISPRRMRHNVPSAHHLVVEVRPPGYFVEVGTIPVARGVIWGNDSVMTY